MGKQSWKQVLLISALLFGAVNAHADKCVEPIVDELKQFTSSDIASITAAMQPLANLGADVRVQTLTSFHRNEQQNMMLSLAEYKDFMLRKCPSWQAPDKGLKNNLILILVSPPQQATAIINGDLWTSKFGPKNSSIVSDMNAKFRDRNLVGGILLGLNDLADLASVKASQKDKPLVIQHAADYSGFYSFLKWGLFVVAFGGLVWFVVWLFGRKVVSRGAQAEAQSARGACSSLTTNFDRDVALIEAKVRAATLSDEWSEYLTGLIAAAKSKYMEAMTDFRSADRSQNDPTKNRLSESEYARMTRTYNAISELLKSSRTTLTQAANDLDRAKAGKSVPSTNARVETGSEYSGNRQSRPVVGEVRKPVIPKDESIIRSTPRSRPQTEPTIAATTQGHRHYQQSPVQTSDTNIIIIDETQNHYGRNDDDDYFGSRRRTEAERPVIVDDVVENPSSGGDETEQGWGKTSTGSVTEQSWGQSSSGQATETDWNDNATTTAREEVTESRWNTPSDSRDSY